MKKSFFKNHQPINSYIPNPNTIAIIYNNSTSMDQPAGKEENRYSSNMKKIM